AIGLWIAAILTLGLLSPVLALLALVPLAYHTLSVAALGATPGQKLLGLEVRDMSLAPPTLLQALIQSAIFLLTVPTTAGLALLAVFFLPRRRTLHDLLSNLQVLRRAPRGGELLIEGRAR
ncbi:MAG: RDD family protein, partial [Alphaproteobacteria bacterium]|nr:RDD family protein [Alphaproteobacteria bacterium]